MRCCHSNLPDSWERVLETCIQQKPRPQPAGYLQVLMLFEGGKDFRSDIPCCHVSKLAATHARVKRISNRKVGTA